MSRCKSANQLRTTLAFVFILSLLTGWLTMDIRTTVYAAPSAPVTLTILHTNDFHGQLEHYGSNPGAASLAAAVNTVRTAVGADKVLLVDAGDSMQGSLLSNIQQGLPLITTFKAMGYDATVVGNHDFEWGQAALASRIAEASADFPFLSANIVIDDPNGWTLAPGITPYVIKTIGVAPNDVKVAFIGVTTQETATLNMMDTAGLFFKDPAESIAHYYSEINAIADVIVVLSHLGFNDGGYGYGLPVYGDKTLAQRLNTGGTPVDLILGGHSHTDLSSAVTIGGTTVAQAHSSGRKVGRADITVGTDGSVGIAWSRITVDPLETDPTIAALVGGFVTDPDYQDLINTPIAYTSVPVLRNYNGDSLMGAFINDALYAELNNDTATANDVDMVFNNAGGLRADITSGAYPALITYGTMFSVLPYGNQTVVGDMSGASILALLNQSATLKFGALQTAGIRYEFYNYVDSASSPNPFAWGALNVMVKDKADGLYKPIDPAKTYRVATNEFLAPAGGDLFTAFRDMTNITYWGDMLDLVNARLSVTYPLASPYAGTLDGRIYWDGINARISVGETKVPLDGTKAYTQETNVANLEADAAMFKLASVGIDVDFYLAGAGRNTLVAAGAGPATPYSLYVRDLYTLMPYDNNLIVLRMNGPQIKAILERAYRNYYYYKYVPGYGGYQYYSVGMLDINSGSVITYIDAFPAAYHSEYQYVQSLVIDGQPVDFMDATTYYHVATLKYLALGNVNFNDSGVSLWPLDQVMVDTPYHIRNAAIEYIRSRMTIMPAVEGRLAFVPDTAPPVVSIEFPASNEALQDSVTLLARAADISGIQSVSFSIREPGGDQGTVIAANFENLAAVRNSVTGNWECSFNTQDLPDGNYVTLAKAVDGNGNEGWSSVLPFTIRNWAAIELMPSTAKSKAGRTVPVKFAIRVTAAVDPTQPFVYNDDLTIKIYQTGNLGTPLQVSVFGSKSTDYRIDNLILYVTNFQTLNTPKTYRVEIWRTGQNFMIEYFTFKTTK